MFNGNAFSTMNITKECSDALKSFQKEFNDIVIAVSEKKYFQTFSEIKDLWSAISTVNTNCDCIKDKIASDLQQVIDKIKKQGTNIMKSDVIKKLATMVNNLIKKYLPDTNNSRIKMIAMNGENNPSLLKPDMNRNFFELPKEGKSEPTPWAGWYWPYCVDCINFQWEGRGIPSPTKKYMEAFNITENLEDIVSAQFGVDGVDGAKCKDRFDCSQGDYCGKRTGEENKTGKCIPMWFGICHAWAPAAVLEVEPKHPVTYNNVTFMVNDLKALMTYAYNYDLETTFAGMRCNYPDSSITRDRYGRPVLPCVLDVNPGTYHIALGNILGIEKKSFVEDRDAKSQVWNHPLSKYKINSFKEVNNTEAMFIVTGLKNESYIFNNQSKKFVHIDMTVSVIVESYYTDDGYLGDKIENWTAEDNYEYVLELDNNGTILGGEWVGDSRFFHPDFLWRPVGRTESDYTIRKVVDYNKIKTLWDMGRE